uniref:PHD-type domain-containing protein n=1 Tax=Biomphalaria glabrata TaxID=6526 RepID=A0A2C9L3I8_BIOGL
MADRPSCRFTADQALNIFLDTNDSDMSDLDLVNNFLFKKSLEVINQGEDTRACLLCTILGDDLPDNAGRLLYCGQDDWIHINCALWSAEVFESHDGSLQNVQDAVSRGRKLKCDLCQQVGATVGCCAANCRANYHFMCAKKDKCIFLADQTIFCKAHPEATDIEVYISSNHFSNPLLLYS